VAWVSHVATAAAIAIALLQAVATFAIAYLVSYQLNPAAMAAVLFFGLAIVTPSLRLGHGLDYVAAGRAAAGRVAELLREPALPSGETATLVDDAVLEMEEVSLKTDHGPLIHRLSYRFAPGTLTAITGPSGTGKTALLRVLAGFEPADSGIVHLGRTDIAELDEQGRHLNIQLVPQNTPILSTTVRENLLLSAPNATDAQLNAALSQARIQVDLDADAALLSGGEQQRVGLARLFLSPAPVILLDEPTSALDRQSADQLMAALLHLAHTQGKTLVMVTHDPALAAQADAQITLKGATQQKTIEQKAIEQEELQA
ncbi:ABC transporter ATP-binding protein, partial [Photobacterium sp. MCCC 1A19761]|uniref:ABC transporter ATP-binding protein n=1 Tax=Photobacterium sp. MCCC 1A19761 TaxID=3115000 RepID=UPI00307D405D